MTLPNTQVTTDQKVAYLDTLYPQHTGGRYLAIVRARTAEGKRINLRYLMMSPRLELRTGTLAAYDTIYVLAGNTHALFQTVQEFLASKGYQVRHSGSRFS